jgi:hypothetical protein
MGPSKQDSVLNGIVRHILTALGGALTTKGYIGEGELELAVGAIVTIIGVVWSAVAKRRAK